MFKNLWYDSKHTKYGIREREGSTVSFKKVLIRNQFNLKE